MTRSMGDATHDNVAALAAIRSSLQLVAGYVTGTPDIQWTTADWAQFPGIPRVTIDQGAAGSPIAVATVRDVEQLEDGSGWTWEPAAAVDTTDWTADRPTIYCDQDDLAEILDAGWRRDLWVAIVGWEPGQPYPAIVQQAISLGCNLVAVQNQQDLGGGAYDLSVILDPTWPNKGDHMLYLIEIPQGDYLLSGGRMCYVQSQADATILQNDPDVSTIGGLSEALGAAMLAAFPPGNPAVAVTVGPA